MEFVIETVISVLEQAERQCLGEYEERRKEGPGAARWKHKAEGVRYALDTIRALVPDGDGFTWEVSQLSGQWEARVRDAHGRCGWAIQKTEELAREKAVARLLLYRELERGGPPCPSTTSTG